MPSGRPRTSWSAGLVAVAAATVTLTVALPAHAVAGDPAPDGAYAFAARLDIGDGKFAAPVPVTKPWTYSQTTAGDFNGDGIADLVACDDKKNLWLFPGKKGGTFAEKVWLTGGWKYTQTVAGDFTGSGKADLIARDDDTGTVLRWAGRGNGTFAARVPVSSSY
ncbi:FG-GAP repeat domain-containing protein [Streptomyces paromomycinus]|uniref:ATP/GTP-binding protein n=1 Tax=Streptomyces paromomycinus TaxID=92743 RepID=A0A401WDS3_STREY|nr:VCBS repeat-containing protein [Streptomyces paromomycinus]GCD47496.1 ATP/GTP-binding protein [Streptomyces paromomycinus]